jgi:hypothetical protein
MAGPCILIIEVGGREWTGARVELEEPALNRFRSFCDADPIRVCTCEDTSSIETDVTADEAGVKTN